MVLKTRSSIFAAVPLNRYKIGVDFAGELPFRWMRYVILENDGMYSKMVPARRKVLLLNKTFGRVIT